MGRFIAVALAALVAASAAQAKGERKLPTTPYARYTISGATSLGTADVSYRAYALLPERLPDRTANGGAVLRFGPIGSCRYGLSIAARVVSRDGGESAAERAGRVYPGASAAYVYASGARASAAWRVIRVKGSAHVRGIYTMPANLRTSNVFRSPTTPAWLEVRAIADEHTEECHSGGPRYVGSFLAEAFGAMSATAFVTNAPRLPLPPNPASP